MKFSDLKILLPALGISDLQIKFDTEKECVCATFAHGGTRLEREVPFAEIEAYFAGPPAIGTGPNNDQAGPG